MKRIKLWVLTLVFFIAPFNYPAVAHADTKEVSEPQQTTIDTSGGTDPMFKPAPMVAPITAPTPQALPTLSPITVSAPVAAPVATNDAPSNCGDNQWAHYIYEHESGCSTTVRNAEGCLGIGQACPGSKLLAACPNLDYDCENAFFTAYANAKGGWEAAYNLWVSQGWW